MKLFPDKTRFASGNKKPVFSETAVPGMVPIVIFLVFLLLLVSGCSDQGDHERQHLNILLITLDTTRADHLGCYGYDKDTTPFIDEFASSGVLFRRAFSASAVTPVSHASILTGYYPYRHGLRVIYAGQHCKLGEEIPTLATVLHSRGWSTAAFLSSFTVSSFYGLDKGFDIYDSGIEKSDAGYFEKKSSGKYVWALQKNQRRSDDTTNRALNWLTGAREPFFLWVHFWDPHDAAILPPVENMKKFIDPGAPIKRKKKQLYDAEINFVDSQFGRLLDFLKKNKLEDRTVIVLTADHGEGLGDHGWWFHRILYDEQIKVPLIVRIPGWKSGEKVEIPAKTVDIVPTVLKAVLPDYEDDSLDGIDLRALVDGDGSEHGNTYAYADAINKYDLNTTLFRQRPWDDLVYCATDGKWKLLFRPDHPEKNELFDIIKDPGETTNLYERHPEEAKRLKNALDEFNGYVEGPFSGNAPDRQIFERLRSLGYVDDDGNS